MASSLKQRNLWQRHRKQYNVLMDRIRHSSVEHQLKYQRQREKYASSYRGCSGATRM